MRYLAIPRRPLSIALYLGSLVLIGWLLQSAAWAQAGMDDSSGMHHHMTSAAGATGEESSFFGDLLKKYTPRQVCMNYEQSVIWLHFATDLVIALAYFTIPLALVRFVVKRKDLVFNWMFVCFAVFILACGLTHVMNIIALWDAFYRVDGLVKVVTALASIGTAGALWQLIPAALALPSPAQLRVANQNLQTEISDRRRAEEELRLAHATLEQRVADRTRELERANEVLRSEIEARRLFELTERRLVALVESSNDAIVGTTLDGTITNWNQAATRLLGYPAAEVLGKSIDITIPPDLIPHSNSVIQRLRAGERMEHVETVRQTKDGRPIHISLALSPIRSAMGEIIGLSQIARDITDKKRAESEREILLASERAARSSAERASRLKDEFLSTLSHELRTPLTAILGWTHILLRGSKSGEEVQGGLQIIERNARAQTQIIEDLLDMSRIISGKIRLSLERFDLASAVDAAIQTVKPAADAKGIKIVSIGNDTECPITGDAARLQQIFWNLLTNALKFTPAGGMVRVVLNKTAYAMTLTVIDTGEGISADFLPHVFDRFRQADASTTRQHGGLGLGLAIVKQLVELHGGTVRADSAGQGTGATFTITLPLVNPPLPEPQSDEEIRASQKPFEQADDVKIPIAGVKVLICDDEVDTRALLQQILQDRNATVTVASCAAEAFELLRCNSPDVFVSDIGMPGEDGYSLIRRIRSLDREAGGTVPAIALTAYARSEDRMRAIAAGFQMHIAKPVEPEELITMIASLAGRMGA